MELFFDTETSGFPKDGLTPDDPNQAWVVQFGYILSNRQRIYSSGSFLIKSKGRDIHPMAQKVHGFSKTEADAWGFPEMLAAVIITDLMSSATTLVCHNFDFDFKMVNFLLAREKFNFDISEALTYCTMKQSTNLCKLPHKNRRAGYKWPKLEELHQFLFNESFEGAHDAMADVMATRRCYYEMVKPQETPEEREEDEESNLCPPIW